MTTLLEYAERADRCHTRLCQLAENDRTKWTPQYQRMLDAHEIKKRFDAELDAMAANAYPESWVRDVILGQESQDAYKAGACGELLPNGRPCERPWAHSGICSTR